MLRKLCVNLALTNIRYDGIKVLEMWQIYVKYVSTSDSNGRL